MNTLYIQPNLPEAQRRKLLYQGQLMLLGPTPASLALCAFARGLIEQAFGSLDPRKAHESLPVEEYVAILSELKPRFIHHPVCKRLIKEILAETGHDLSKTYFDVPRMRSAAPHDYLRYGIAYAFHPHRDTWYSAPFCQLNWWMPIYEIESGNSMAFHPKYWNLPLRNGSAAYNYQQWNRQSRKNAGAHIKTDTREQPKAEEHVELEPQLRIVAPVGSMIQFSGAHLHSTVPNATGITRFSIDFRTVDSDDAHCGGGALNIDSNPTGTTLMDYIQGGDFSHLPEELIRSRMLPEDALEWPGHGR